MSIVKSKFSIFLDSMHARLLTRSIPIQLSPIPHSFERSIAISREMIPSMRDIEASPHENEIQHFFPAIHSTSARTCSIAQLSSNEDTVSNARYSIPSQR